MGEVTAPLKKAELAEAIAQLSFNVLDAHLAARPVDRDHVIEKVWQHALSSCDPSSLDQVAAWTGSRPAFSAGISYPLMSNNPGALSWVLDHHDWSQGRLWAGGPTPDTTDLPRLADLASMQLMQTWHEKQDVVGASLVLMERFPDLFSVLAPRPNLIRAPQLLNRMLDDVVKGGDANTLASGIRWLSKLRNYIGQSPHLPQSAAHCWYHDFLSNASASKVLEFERLLAGSASLRDAVSHLHPIYPRERLNVPCAPTHTVAQFLLASAAPSLVDLFALPSDHAFHGGLREAMADDNFFGSFVALASARSPGMLHRMVSRYPEIASRFLEFRSASSPAKTALHILLEHRADESLMQSWSAMDRWLITKASSLMSVDFPDGQSVLEYSREYHPSWHAKVVRQALGRMTDLRQGPLSAKRIPRM